MTTEKLKDGVTENPESQSSGRLKRIKELAESGHFNRDQLMEILTRLFKLVLEKDGYLPVKSQMLAEHGIEINHWPTGRSFSDEEIHEIINKVNEKELWKLLEDTKVEPDSEMMERYFKI